MSNLDKWKKFKDRKTPATVPLGKEFFDYVPGGARVLDFGCAFGRISFELYNKGYEVVGFDVNENEIGNAREDVKNMSLGSRIRFDVANATKLPYSDGSFDAAVMVAFMVTVVDPKDRVEVLNEAYRVLKDDGILYLSAIAQTPENESYARRYEEHFPVTKEWGTFVVTDTHDVGGKELYRCHHYSESELRGLLGDKFNILSFKPDEFRTPSGNKINGFRIVAKK